MALMCRVEEPSTASTGDIAGPIIAVLLDAVLPDIKVLLIGASSQLIARQLGACPDHPI
jgi:hypothetical protein